MNNPRLGPSGWVPLNNPRLGPSHGERVGRKADQKVGGRCACPGVEGAEQDGQGDKETALPA